MQLKLYYFYKKDPNGYIDKLAHDKYFLSYNTIEGIYSNIWSEGSITYIFSSAYQIYMYIGQWLRERSNLDVYRPTEKCCCFFLFFWRGGCFPKQ